jgi:integrase/recombinase XerD
LAVLGKGVLQKEKIPLIKKCHDILLEYKKTLPDTQKRIFAIEETRTVRQIVAKWFKITKLNRDKLSAHSLRHTTAQVMIYEGVPKAMVKRFLRHQSELSTNVYTGKQEDANFLSFEFEQKEIGQ